MKIPVVNLFFYLFIFFTRKGYKKSDISKCSPLFEDDITCISFSTGDCQFRSCQWTGVALKSTPQKKTEFPLFQKSMWRADQNALDPWYPASASSYTSLSLVLQRVWMAVDMQSDLIAHDSLKKWPVQIL